MLRILPASGMPTWSAGLLVVALSLCTAVARAQVLDEIVVTANRMETAARATSRSVSVVDAARLAEATQKLGLDEALAQVPGLYIQNRYNFAQDLRISLRGFGSRSSFGIRGIRLYVDGIPGTLPDGQGQVDSIDLGSIGRVEVLRGPASAQYGNAAGGVIAVTTALPDTGRSLEFGVAGGEPGLGRARFAAAGAGERLRYRLNLTAESVDGYRTHSGYRNRRLNGKFAFALGESDSLDVTLNLTDQPLAEDPGGIDAEQAERDPESARDANVFFDAGETLSQQRAGFVYTRERASGTLTLRNYYVLRDFENRLPFEGGGAVDLDRFFYGGGAKYEFGSSDSGGLRLIAGFDYDRQADDRVRFDNVAGERGQRVFDQAENVTGTGAYLQGRYDFADTWTVSAGLRYDDVSFDVDDRYLADGDDSGRIAFRELSPSVGVTADFGTRVLFFNAGTAFETPTTTELANPDAAGGFNQQLRPQLARHYELGVRGEQPALAWELSAFHIDGDDELIPYELAEFPGRTFYENAGTTSRTGIEAYASWRHSSGLGAELSWTWSDFVYDRFIAADGDDFSGNLLPGLPGRHGYGALTYAAAQFDARLEAVYVGSRYADNANDVEVDAHTVVNLRARRTFRARRWSLDAYIGINNLADERYFGNLRINAFGGRYYEPAPDRNLYAGFDLRFDSTGLR
jgi:iron complex outermembrane receptor protein